MKITEYRIPQMRRIGRGGDTKQLYKAEDRLIHAQRAAREALAGVLAAYGLPADEWKDANPESLFSFLDSQDLNASFLACFSFLKWYRENRADQYRAAFDYFTDTTGPHTCPACNATTPEGGRP